MDDTFLLASRAAAYAPHMLLHESLLPLLLDTATVRVGGGMGTLQQQGVTLLVVLVQHAAACQQLCLWSP